MKKYFSQNGYQIVRMMINQVGITVMGIVLSMVFATNATMLVVTSIFCIGFYLFLLFNMTYELGQKDEIKIKGGRMEFKPLKGLFLSLWANMINFVLGAVAVVSRLLITNYSFFQDFSDAVAAEPRWAANIFGITEMIARSIQGMYLGINAALFSGNTLTMVIMPIPALITCAIAYYLGVKIGNRERKAK